MGKKEECKKIMSRLFGPASAALVDSMSEEDCVEKCRKKVMAVLGPEEAKVFDAIGGA